MKRNRKLILDCGKVKKNNSTSAKKVNIKFGMYLKKCDGKTKIQT